MKRSLQALTMLGMVCSAVGCGGGGGGDDSDNAPSFAGVWRGSVAVTENTCNVSNVLPTLQFTHTVNQNEEAIVLDANNGQSFIGNTVGREGFSVDSPGEINEELSPVAACSSVERIEYSAVNDDDDNTADVHFTFTGTCSGTPNCRVTYIGSATRGGSAGGPTPEPTTSPTPSVAPDCVNMHERSYSGDLGCGFGDVTLEVTGSTIVLEPLGVNGSTSFVQDPNPINATSTRNDLTVNGLPGYTCALECTAPLTFEVECRTEGGASCKEKY